MKKEGSDSDSDAEGSEDWSGDEDSDCGGVLFLSANGVDGDVDSGCGRGSYDGDMQW